MDKEIVKAQTQMKTKILPAKECNIYEASVQEQK